MSTSNLGLKNDFVNSDFIPEAWLNSIANATDSALRTGHLATDVAGTGDKTLAVAEYDATSLEFTGILTGNRNIILPLTAGRWWGVLNNTTGAFTLTVKGATGAGVVVPQGARMLLLCDGTDFQPALSSTATLTAENAGAINSGDATTDAVIGNLRTRLGELEAAVQALGVLV